MALVIAHSPGGILRAALGVDRTHDGTLATGRAARGARCEADAPKAKPAESGRGGGALAPPPPRTRPARNAQSRAGRRLRRAA
ncbi:hypothetical protein, partial [Burkholderia glumae]|uniref:hypothetical protein n=1 Tax=Burkholderia glumae TaxID=337 RepID=UPI0020CBC0E8